MKQLGLLEEGDKGEVVSIASDLGIKKRLMDIGICTGSDIECVKKSSVNGLMALLVKGSVFAIRQDDAKNIFIQ